MLHVGIVGIGFMGMIHYLAYQRVPGVRVAAICSRDKKRLSGDWRGIQGNFGPTGKKMNLSRVRKYQALEAMLADTELDLIDICLPAQLHCEASLAALKAGKHVFCEKPIALAAADAAKMLRAAASAKCQLLVGHVLPFLPEYAFVLAAARSGKYGRPIGAHFRRVIADPLWIGDYYDPRIHGGPLMDLHIHDAHFIRLLFGMPKAVFSRGRMRGEVAQYVETQFVCADSEQVVSAAAGVIGQQGRSFNQAFEVHFERATLVYNFAVMDGKPHLATPLTVLDEKNRVECPKLGSADPTEGFVAEVAEVVRSVSSHKPSTILNGDLAANALSLCHKQAESMKAGKLLRL